jgi:adenine nucleotide transporter 17
MAQQEGVTSLWNGTIPSLILVSNPAIQFMTYEAIKRRLHALCDKQHLSGLVYFFVGAVAKAVATVLTYPLQLVQTKLRVRIHHPCVRVHSGPIYESTFLEYTHHILPPGAKFNP